MNKKFVGFFKMFCFTESFMSQRLVDLKYQYETVEFAKSLDADEVAHIRATSSTSMLFAL